MSFEPFNTFYSIINMFSSFIEYLVFKIHCLLNTLNIPNEQNFVSILLLITFILNYTNCKIVYKLKLSFKFLLLYKQGFQIPIQVDFALAILRVLSHFMQFCATEFRLENYKIYPQFVLKLKLFCKASILNLEHLILIFKAGTSKFDDK